MPQAVPPVIDDNLRIDLAASGREPTEYLIGLAEKQVQRIKFEAINLAVVSALLGFILGWWALHAIAGAIVFPAVLICLLIRADRLESRANKELHMAIRGLLEEHDRGSG